MVDDSLSLTFAALADPTRRAILARLADGEATVNELAEPFAITLQAVSKHLKVLERAGLITRGRSAQWRPCRLETAPLEVASEWIGQYREMWADRFDRLDQEIRDIQAGWDTQSSQDAVAGQGIQRGQDIRASQDIQVDPDIQASEEGHDHV